MKSKITFFTLFFSITFFAQEKEEKSIESYQLEYINSGNKFLSKSKGLNALYSFYFATSFNFDNEPMTEYEKYARTKVDSLLPIYQAIEKEKWKGKWKLKQLKFNDYNYEYIEITDSTVIFYNKDSINTPCRIEKIKFANYDKLNMFNFYKCLEFENNEIWEFTFEKVKGEKRLIIFIVRNTSGTGYFLVDDRSLIKDRKKRKEAIKQEIKTYYVFEE